MTSPANRNRGLKSRGEYRQLCAEVLERDLHDCQVCGQPAASVHHLRPLVLGGKNIASNLTALCEYHHTLADAAHEAAIAAAARESAA